MGANLVPTDLDKARQAYDAIMIAAMDVHRQHVHEAKRDFDSRMTQAKRTLYGELETSWKGYQNARQRASEVFAQVLDEARKARDGKHANQSRK